MAERADRREGFLHRELGARADREMRRVRRIADEHPGAVVPVPAYNSIEIEPGRAVQVPRVGQERSVAEIGREQLLAECDRLVYAGLIEPVRRPGLLARFHDDRGEVLAELIGVNLKPAEVGLLERKSERRELLRRAQPNVPALAPLDAGAELLDLPRPGLAVGALGNHHEIRAAELIVVVDLVLEGLFHAQRGGALLENVEQLAARDAGETVAAGAHGLALEVHVDVVPVVELVDDARMRGCVRFEEISPVAVRKHHAPAAGVIRTVALEYLDGGARQRLFEQNRGIEAGGAAAHADNSLHTSL